MEQVVRPRSAVRVRGRGAARGGHGHVWGNVPGPLMAWIAVLLLPWLGEAAVFPCAGGDVTCLKAAIHTANGNGEANTITLAAGTYPLTAVDNDTEGANGLPSITGTITIRGVGAEATSIERAGGPFPPVFRLIHVAAGGVLTLDALSLRGGRTDDIWPIESQSGGGILNHGGVVTLTACRLIRNGALGAGGGLFNDGGTVTVMNSTLTENSADGGGGAFYNGGTATIMDSTIAGNSASNSSCAGLGNGSQGLVRLTNSTVANNIALNSTGGICNDGTMIITNSTVAGNTADLRGGGITNHGMVTLSNSTVANNHVSWEGGGIYNHGGTVTLSNSTVADNSVFQKGGGINNASGTVALQNTILARNAARDPKVGEGPDCFGRLTSLGHNLIGDPTGCDLVGHGTDLSGDPGLGEFTDDGRPGHGHVPLLATSQAVDAGDDAACPDTDQVGHPRSGPCDIGAMEFHPRVLTVTIDIKPGSGTNRIIPWSRGVIPVAVLTTEGFDATTLDPRSVRFGPQGAPEAHGQGHREDVNDDGEPDLVLHFRTRATGIQCGETSASLTGETFDGALIQGADTINTVACKKK